MYRIKKIPKSMEKQVQYESRQQRSGDLHNWCNQLQNNYSNDKLGSCGCNLSHTEKNLHTQSLLQNGYSFSLEEIENITSQLPKQFIIFSNFNSHDILQSSARTDSREKIIEVILNKPDTALIDDPVIIMCTIMCAIVGEPICVNQSGGVNTRQIH